MKAIRVRVRVRVGQMAPTSEPYPSPSLSILVHKQTTVLNRLVFPTLRGDEKKQWPSGIATVVAYGGSSLTQSISQPINRRHIQSVKLTLRTYLIRGVSNEGGEGRSEHFST